MEWVGLIRGALRYDVIRIETVAGGGGGGRGERVFHQILLFINVCNFVSKN